MHAASVIARVTAAMLTYMCVFIKKRGYFAADRYRWCVVWILGDIPTSAQPVIGKVTRKTKSSWSFPFDQNKNVLGTVEGGCKMRHLIAQEVAKRDIQQYNLENVAHNTTAFPVNQHIYLVCTSRNWLGYTNHIIIFNWHRRIIAVLCQCILMHNQFTLVFPTTGWCVIVVHTIFWPLNLRTTALIWHQVNKEQGHQYLQLLIYIIILLFLYVHSAIWQADDFLNVLSSGLGGRMSTSRRQFTALSLCQQH